MIMALSLEMSWLFRMTVFDSLTWMQLPGISHLFPLADPREPDFFSVGVFHPSLSTQWPCFDSRAFCLFSPASSCLLSWYNFFSGSYCVVTISASTFPLHTKFFIWTNRLPNKHLKGSIWSQLWAYDSPGELVKTQIGRPHPRISCFLHLGCAQKFVFWLVLG